MMSGKECICPKARVYQWMLTSNAGAWRDKRGVPAAKIGRLLKFKISEVDAWMKSGVAAEQ